MPPSARRDGVPTRLTRCSASRCETNGVAPPGAGERLSSTMSSSSRSSARSSSPWPPERSPTSTSSRASIGRSRPIWKLRESVASAPTLRRRRVRSVPLRVGQQLLAGGEDHVGVLERDPAGLGQVQPPAAPLEQRQSQPILELPDLGGTAPIGRGADARAARVRLPSRATARK